MSVLIEMDRAVGVGRGVSAPSSAGGPRFWSSPGAARRRLLLRDLLRRYDAAPDVPEPLAVQRSFTAAEYVCTTFDCVREETALVGRRMLQRGTARSAILDEQIEQLRSVTELAQSLAAVGRDLHTRYAEGIAERPMVASFEHLADAARELLVKLQGFQQKPCGETWPYHAFSLHLDAWLIDRCAHKVKAFVGDDPEQLGEVYCGSAGGSDYGEATVVVPLDGPPRFVRLEVGGFASLGYRHVRLESLEGTRLPSRVVATEGQVANAEHLLAFDQKIAVFNEPDVIRNWLSLEPLPVNGVLVEF